MRMSQPRRAFSPAGWLRRDEIFVLFAKVPSRVNLA
jgi:hypothetical protein